MVPVVTLTVWVVTEKAGVEDPELNQRPRSEPPTATTTTTATMMTLREIRLFGGMGAPGAAGISAVASSPPSPRAEVVKARMGEVEPTEL
jgi:hypothetical protein